MQGYLSGLRKEISQTKLAQCQQAWQRQKKRKKKSTQYHAYSFDLEITGIVSQTIKEKNEEQNSNFHYLHQPSSDRTTTDFVGGREN